MKPWLIALTAVALLGLAARAEGACGWSGTQVECDLGGKRLMMGTQNAVEPDCGRTLGLLPLQGCDGLPDHHAASEGSFGLQLQNVGVDARLCRRIGNETYCY